MSVLTIITIVCFSSVMLIGMLFACLYLFRRRFMPYHADAVGKSWNDLDKEVRILIIALMRVAGGGWMASSVAIGIFLYSFIRNGDHHAFLAMVITGLAVSIPTLLATDIVKRKTRARPPQFAVELAIALLTIGLTTGLLAI